ncbi:hypothetical protein Taro_003191 [Colocasia esculenta]|uniref:Uncharacterized protein n=1 Tax=Colocasia esculenta TaxID=4460 RepID=A0A843TJ55_COLES|nr:hypothetical protein [Colocasia esculenta]
MKKLPSNFKEEEEEDQGSGVWRWRRQWRWGEEKGIRFFKGSALVQVTVLSNVEAKKRFEFLEAVSGTMDAHLRYFKQSHYKNSFLMAMALVATYQLRILAAAPSALTGATYCRLRLGVEGEDDGGG